MTKFQSGVYNDVHGTSVIDHKLRVKMGLMMVEYVMLDFIHRVTIQKKAIDYGRIRRWTGLTDANEIRRIIGVLENKGLIIVEDLIEDGKAKRRIKGVSRKFQNICHTKEDDDFETFWSPAFEKKWTGSKQEAKKLFQVACSKFGASHVLNQKFNYFKFLSLPENAYRSVMMATVFLNMTKQRFNEPWDEYLATSIEKTNLLQTHEVVKPSTTTLEDHEKAFD